MEVNISKQCKINADKALLITAFENIIANAIYYNKSKGSILISATDKKSKVEIQIKDTGVGIRDEDQKSLFSQFYRGSDAPAMKTDGSGLGLFIAKAIIETHGGKIWFTSIYTKGATFFIELPNFV